MVVKCVLRYLVGTHNLAICYDKQLTDPHDMTTLLPVGYANANWGNSNADQCSISGVIFLLTGGPILWTTKTQQCVTLSLMEAEINAISKGAHKALFLHCLMPTFISKLDHPIMLYNNNQSLLMIVTALNGMYHC